MQLVRSRIRVGRVGVRQVATAPVHVTEGRPLGQRGLREGGQRNLGRAEEEGPLPVPASHGNPLLTLTKR